MPDLWVEKFVPAGTATGLDKPERTITVTRADGKPVTVLIGGVSRTETKTEPAPPPPMFGAPPPPPRITTEEYRYAKLKDNELVFELRTDKLNDLFADPRGAARRDPGPVRDRRRDRADRRGEGQAAGQDHPQARATRTPRRTRTGRTAGTSATCSPRRRR